MRRLFGQRQTGKSLNGTFPFPLIFKRYFLALGKCLSIFENTVEQRRRDIKVSRSVDAAEVVKTVVAERNKLPVCR